MASAERLTDELRSFLDSHPEWLIEWHDRGSFAVRAREVVFRLPESGPPTVSFPFEKGIEERVIADFIFADDETSLEVFDAADGVIETLRIIRRQGLNELRAETEKARIELANRIAAAFAGHFGRSRVAKVKLSQDGGRFAEIACEDASARKWLAVADVSQSLSPERLLSTAVLLLDRLSTRKRNPVARIGVIGNRRQASSLRRLLDLLSEKWCTRIDLYELKESPAADEIELEEMSASSVPDSEKSFGLSCPEVESTVAVWAKTLHPAIDVIKSGQGETLRFHGLPFARTRSVAGREVVWCGVGRRRIVQTAECEAVLCEQVAELAARRRADTPDKRHEYFRLAPEAWLESLLRRDIKRLDPNLILSPVHEQFRAGREKIDLLALRSDGRLVIIEVKVTADRDMVYQSLDYWRKIEALRRSGVLDGQSLFGTHPVSDRPAIIYLVAPTFSFPPETELFLSTVSDEVEFCRFELVENWRERVRVSRRIT